MSNAITPHNGSDLAISSDQTFWTDRQQAALAQIGVNRATNGDLAVFFHQCQRTGLDPFARQIYMIERQGKQTIQTGIDGFRLIASRTGQLHGYEDTLWCGEDGQWVDVWLKREQPAAAKVTVLRNGARYPAVALFTEYAATKLSGELTQMWATKGALMLAKCAEALALRKAFPQDLSGLYTSDEMQQAGNTVQPAQAPKSSMSRLADAAGVEPLDPDVFVDQVNSATDVDSLRVLWQHAAGLPDDLVGDVRAIIQARVESLTADTHEDAGELPVDAETVEGVSV